MVSLLIISFALSACSPKDPFPLEGGWDSFVSNAGSEITESGDVLWQSLIDSRIKTVMPMGLEGAWLFGERC